MCVCVCVCVYIFQTHWVLHFKMVQFILHKLYAKKLFKTKKEKKSEMKAKGWNIFSVCADISNQNLPTQLVGVWISVNTGKLAVSSDANCVHLMTEQLHA